MCSFIKICLLHFIYKIAFLSVSGHKAGKQCSSAWVLMDVQERDAEAGITWHRETFPNHSMILSSHLGIPLSKASQHNYNWDLNPINPKVFLPNPSVTLAPTLSSSPSSQNDLTFTPLFRTTIFSASPSMFLELRGYILAISRHWTHSSA